MISTQYALCAKRIIQDTQENTISLIDVIDEIVSSGFPIVLPRLSVIWVLQKETADAQVHQGSIVFFRDDEQLQEFPVEIDFQQTDRTRCIVVIGGMPINQPGIIGISFRRGGKEDARFSFPVKAHAQMMPANGQANLMM